MTISSETRTTSPFVGNDSITSLPFAFKVFSTGDVAVIKTLTSTGAETTLTLTTDYTVTLNANQDVSPGGTVTLVTALPTGYTAVVDSDIDCLQPASFQNGFLPSALTGAIDRQNALIAQLKKRLASAFRFSHTKSAANVIDASEDGYVAIVDGQPEVVTPSADSSAALALALAANSGAELVGADDGASGAKWDDVQGFIDYENETIGDTFLALSQTGSSDYLTAINDAIAACVPGPLWLPPGDFPVSAAPTNTRGVQLDGPGRILKAITGGSQQLNSYADKFQHVTGREYLAAFWRRIIDGNGCNIVMSGDSTTAGTGVSGDYVPSTLLQKIARAKGIFFQVPSNRGQSGKHSGDWVSSYVAGDITNGGNTPHLIIVRWGINDPYFSRTITQYITSMRAGLAQIRATLGVDDCAILLMSPNSTSDTPGGRDERWYEQVSPALRKMAREYQCCFFDTYAWCQDSRGAANIWMDDPYTDGRAIHPLDVMNAAIFGGVGDVLYPDGLIVRAGNRFQNLGNSDVSGKGAADLASTYDAGITIHRALSASGWPRDGAVMTFRHRDGTYALQMNWSSSADAADYSPKVRIGDVDSWSAWGDMGPQAVSIDALTLANSWVSYLGAYSIQARKQHNQVQLNGLISSGTMTTGTVITTLPAGYRPGSTRWFSCPTNTAGQSAVLYVQVTGDVTIQSCPSNGFLSLDPITFFV